MQTLWNDYNIKTIKIYDAAGHRKGLIDAMSSFGVKSILCQHLRYRNYNRMIYSSIDPKFLDKFRSEKKEIKIKDYMLGHLLVYERTSTKILMNEYLCD